MRILLSIRTIFQFMSGKYPFMYTDNQREYTCWITDDGAKISKLT